MDQPAGVNKFQYPQDLLQQLNYLALGPALAGLEFRTEGMSFDELLHQVELLVFFKVS